MAPVRAILQRLRLSGLWHEMPLTLAQLRWGYSMALSRTFEGGYLVPLVDMCNHSPRGPWLSVVRTADTLPKAVKKGTAC